MNSVMHLLLHAVHLGSARCPGLHAMCCLRQPCPAQCSSPWPYTQCVCSKNIYLVPLSLASSTLSLAPSIVASPRPLVPLLAHLLPLNGLPLGPPLNNPLLGPPLNDPPSGPLLNEGLTVGPMLKGFCNNLQRALKFAKKPVFAQGIIFNSS